MVPVKSAPIIVPIPTPSMYPSIEIEGAKVINTNIKSKIEYTPEKIV